MVLTFCCFAAAAWWRTWWLRAIHLSWWRLVSLLALQQRRRRQTADDGRRGSLLAGRSALICSNCLWARANWVSVILASYSLFAISSTFEDASLFPLLLPLLLRVAVCCCCCCCLRDAVLLPREFVLCALYKCVRFRPLACFRLHLSGCFLRWLSSIGARSTALNAALSSPFSVCVLGRELGPKGPT